MNLLPYVIIWAVLAAVVIVLAIYRGVVSGRVDEIVHVAGGTSSLTGEQIAISKKLEIVDRWGKILTVLVVLFGLALGAAYLYQGWNRPLPM